jgi:hypothetical protein
MKRQVEVHITVEVEVDETKFTEKFMQESRPKWDENAKAHKEAGEADAAPDK